MSAPAPAFGNVPISRLRFHEHNVKRDLGDLRALARSIKEYGVLEPIVVERYGDMLRIRDGHRRMAAAEQAGLKRIPALVHGDRLDDVEWLKHSIQHNEQRAEVGEAARRDAVAKLRAAGMTLIEITAEFGVTLTTVRAWAREPQADRPSRARRRPPQVIGARRLREDLDECRAAVEAGELDAWGVLNRLEALLPPAPRSEGGEEA